MGIPLLSGGKSHRTLAIVPMSREKVPTPLVLVVDDERSTCPR
jgi:hypothetical protein